MAESAYKVIELVGTSGLNQRKCRVEVLAWCWRRRL
jgi:flavin-binding protein dodecin